MTPLGGDPLCCLGQRHIGLGKIECAPEGVIQRSSQVGCEFLLQHQAQAVGVKAAASIAEGSGIVVWQKESAGSSDFSNAGECRVADAVRKSGDLEVGVLD